jgi:hypothetical protein
MEGAGKHSHTLSTRTAPNIEEILDARAQITFVLLVED